MQKLSIGQAWEETSSFLKKEARLVVPVALAAFAVPSALAGWAMPVAAVGGGGDPGLLATLVILIIAMIGQMTIAGLALGIGESVGGLIGRAGRRVWGMLAAVAFIFLPLTILAVIVLGSILGARGVTDPSQVTPQTLAAIPSVQIFVLLMLIVMLVAASRLFPMAAIAMNETARPLALLARSWALTKGNFARLVGLLLLMLVAAVVFSAATRSVVGTLVTLVIGEARPFNLSALLIGLAVGLASAAVTAVSAALVARVYAQLSADSGARNDVA